MVHQFCLLVATKIHLFNQRPNIFHSKDFLLKLKQFLRFVVNNFHYLSQIRIYLSFYEKKIYIKELKYLSNQKVIIQQIYIIFLKKLLIISDKSSLCIKPKLNITNFIKILNQFITSALQLFKSLTSNKIEEKMKSNFDVAETQSEHQKQVIKESLLANDFDWIIQSQSHKHHHFGGLALGNVKFAQNQKQLRKNHIGAIISVFGEKSLFVNPNIKHFRILISDNSSQNIKCFFNSAYVFISQNIKHTNVLVHCQAGVSRSPTIVASYLMKQKNMNVETSLQQIRKKRRHICPNKGFVKQLYQYQRQVAQQYRNKGQGNCEVM